MGGGARACVTEVNEHSGASPRGRRSRGRDRTELLLTRRISAWAEEPRSSSSSTDSPAAHLRVGGGAGRPENRTLARTGASPRGRRSRIGGSVRAAKSGRISAWAEEPGRVEGARARAGAHLRVGGGALRRWRARTGRTGASPRGRRSRGYDAPRIAAPRRISAWAEEPAVGRRPGAVCGAHLRVGGGADPPSLIGDGPQGASPRGRRSPWWGWLLVFMFGRISAWAEEPTPPRPTSPSRWAHLRVGGGARPRRLRASLCCGASPRGRRSPPLRRMRGADLRRISAWAEEPRGG